MFAIICVYVMKESVGTAHNLGNHVTRIAIFILIN